MDEQSSSSKKLQWKWVAITFVLYVIFYALPMAIAPELLKSCLTIETVFICIWMFGGIIIVAAIAAYFSKGRTIIEPAIAGALMVILLLIILTFYMIYTHPGARFDIKREVLPMVEAICIVFVLSPVGAWIGERAQKLF